MPFAEILGQAEALARLTRAIETGRLAHAYLFEGPDGVGKLMTARALARMVLCPQKGRCKDCATCSQIARDSHPMVRLYELPRGSRNIGVDVIRDDLIPFLNLRSARGEYKVAIIDPAESLSEEAANSLLKTLEEPASWSLLILLTTTAEALLPTIQSRCQRVRFSRIPERLIADRLVREMELAPEHAHALARLSSGSMGRALELAGRDFAAWRVRALDTFAALIAGKADPVEMARTWVAIAGETAKGLQERRVEAQELLNLLLTYLRDLVIALEHEDSVLHGDRPTLTQEAALLDEEQAFEILDRVFETKDDIAKNVNIQLALEELCMEIEAIVSHRSGVNA